MLPARELGRRCPCELADVAGEVRLVVVPAGEGDVEQLGAGLLQPPPCVREAQNARDRLGRQTDLRAELRDQSPAAAADGLGQRADPDSAGARLEPPPGP